MCRYDSESPLGTLAKLLAALRCAHLQPMELDEVQLRVLCLRVDRRDLHRDWAPPLPTSAPGLGSPQRVYGIYTRPQRHIRAGADLGQRVLELPAERHRLPQLGVLVVLALVPAQSRRVPARCGV
jgi:hypothetical protein